MDDDPDFWKTVRSDGREDQWLELDLYKHIDNLVNEFVADPNDKLLEGLIQTASWSEPISFT